MQSRLTRDPHTGQLRAILAEVAEESHGGQAAEEGVADEEP